jgi:ribokinase
MAGGVPARIVVVGGINMDVHLFGADEQRPDRPLLVDHYLTEPGGKGANVARAAARLGARVSLVGRVGEDSFGRACLAALDDDGVDVTGVLVTPDEPTGFVSIELENGLHRSLVYVPGANDSLTWSDVAPAVERLTTGDILIVQAEIPPETLRRVTKRTADDGVRLYLDPAPPDRVPLAALRAAEVVTPDRAEAAALTGRIDSSQVWPALAAADLRALGAPCVIVKTGASGAVLAVDGDVVGVPTLAVEAIDETGAGDVFLAALAVRRAEGAGWQEAVRFANAASAISVSAPGLSLPVRAQVDAAAAGLTAPATPLLAAPHAVSGDPRIDPAAVGV